MKNLFLRLSSVVIILAALVAACQHNSVGNIAISISQPITFDKFVNKQEQKIWQTFEEYGIPRAEFYKRKAIKARKKRIKPEQQIIHSQIKQLFYQIARDFDVDPTTVEVKAVKSAKSHAWVDHQTMKINESEFLNLPQEAQQFVLAHEIQHLIFDDHEDRYTLVELVGNKLDDENVANDLLNQFYRFQEERADVLAAIKNQKYAHAYYVCMQNYLDTLGDISNPEHPKMSDRVKLAQQIVTSFDNSKMV